MDVIKGIRLAKDKTVVIESPENDPWVVLALNENGDLVMKVSSHNSPVRVVREIYNDGKGGVYPQLTAEY